MTSALASVSSAKWSEQFMGSGNDLVKRMAFETNAIDRRRLADEATTRGNAEAGAVDLDALRRIHVKVDQPRIRVLCF